MTRLTFGNILQAVVEMEKTKEQCEAITFEDTGERVVGVRPRCDPVVLDGREVYYAHHNHQRKKLLQLFEVMRLFVPQVGP